MSRTRNDRKAQRHEEANVRQEEYDGLTRDQKLARARGRRGHSAKEVKRLEADNG